MRVTMVKKKLVGGASCDKCVQADKLLHDRGLLNRIDEVVWAQEGDTSSPGMRLAAQWGIDTAPFFIVADETGEPRAYASVLKFVREVSKMSQDLSHHDPSRDGAASDVTVEQVKLWAEQVDTLLPQQAMNLILERYGRACAISFSGAEDVALIELAVRSGHPFSVFSLDTGRLHPETYEFIDHVREHYGILIDLYFPEAVAVQELVRNKGLFSFYTEGHQECCSIRKVEPLRRALANYRVWATGQRRDQSPTRSNVEMLRLIRSSPALMGHC